MEHLSVLAHVLIVLQMVLVNLYVSYICSTRKTTPFITWVVLIAFTVVIFTLLFPVAMRMPNYGNGNGLMMLGGLLYIVPLKFLYDQPVKYTVLIMSSSWIYTMIAFSLSFRLGYLLPGNWLAVSVLIFQTLIYLVTLPHFLRFVRDKFVYILKNMEKEGSLLVLSLLWFLFIVLLNYSFTDGSPAILKITIILIFAYNAMLSYRFFYTLVLVNETAKTLRDKTKRDELTKLRNREGLWEDALKNIANKTPFIIIFIDLDMFKDVNDSYGHSTGDQYLITFVNTLKEKLHVTKGFYRMSGDEFVILYRGNNIDYFCRKIEKLQFDETSGLWFRGLSLGYSRYPADGTEFRDLLHLADINMYQKKKEKHRNMILQ